jgi:guanylate kinase
MEVKMEKWSETRKKEETVEIKQRFKHNNHELIMYKYYDAYFEETCVAVVLDDIILEYGTYYRRYDDINRYFQIVRNTMRILIKENEK